MSTERPEQDVEAATGRTTKAEKKVLREGRKCKKCSLPLSIYNPDSVCYSCQRKE